MTQDSQGSNAASTSSPSGSPSGDLTGKTIAGKYQLIRLLGQGGMGAVYEAKNQVTLKRVAVKLLFDEMGQDEGVVKRFFREARASSVIESDYIVQVYDSGHDPVTGYPYMVMEMLHGEDLEELLKKVGCLHPLAVGKIMLQASMGLAKAHAQGIVHRDVKPANIYLTTREDGDVIAKLLDFGIAKVKMEALADQTSAGLTATGSVLGTPLYMSPEQARGLPTVDARSDVWSLGVVMYEMLTGGIPYDSARTLGDLLVAIITADLPLMQEKAPWVPPELAEIVHRAMSRDPDKRYKDAGEMRDAIAALVPDGPRITKDKLVTVDEQYRAIVQPKLTVTDGMLKASTRTGLSMTRTPKESPTPPPKASGNGPIVAATAAGMVLLAGIGVGVFMFTKKAPPPVAAEPPKPVVAAPAAPPPVAAPAPAPAAETTKTFSLIIIPSDATVFVDDQQTKVSNESVRISGVPGTVRTIRVVKDKQSVERVVAITNDGLVPPKVDLAAPPPPRPAFVPGTGKKPAAPAEPAASPKPKNLVTDTSEFQ